MSENSMQQYENYFLFFSEVKKIYSENDFDCWRMESNHALIFQGKKFSQKIDLILADTNNEKEK